MNSKITSSNHTQFHSLSDGFSAAALVFDSGFKIKAVSTRFAELFKLNPGQMEGMAVADYLSRLDEKHSLADALRILDTEPGLGISSIRLQINTKNNATSPMAVRLILLRIKYDKPCYLGIVTHIENADRLARPKITDEHLFNLLLSELPDAIYFKDRTGQFFLTNRLHAKKMGLSSAEDFIGKNDFDLFSEKHAREAYNDEQYVMSSGITISKEEKETRLDGSETWASTSKMPLKNEEGETVGTFGISKDITQIKNAEIQLREAKQILQEANDAKDKFFSILAHDLKNPFNSLLGLSEILVEDFDLLANDDKLDMVKKIRRTSESAYALLENLLDWSRMQRGSMHIEPESVNLKQIVDEVIALNYLQAFNKNITLQTEVNDRLRVFADQNMLKTIIRNLVSNAIKFTMPGGKVKISGRIEDSSTHISVEDNGIGMDSDSLKKMFSIGEVNKTYGTNDESGTGLGLIICREFAWKNKGDIRVLSQEDRGSTFTVILPKG